MLISEFHDAAGQLKDPDDLNTVYASIYPVGVDPTDPATIKAPDVPGPGDAVVYRASMLSGGAGSLANPANVIQHVDEGVFVYSFDIPDTWSEGIAYDFWEGTVDGQALEGSLSYSILEEGTVTEGGFLRFNNTVFVELDKSIASLPDGIELGIDYQWYFTTKYSPLYSSVKRIRLDIGPFIRDVPDDTVNMAIFEASLQADALTFGVATNLTPSARRFFIWARRQYVTCLAEIILLSAISGQDLSGGGGGKSKRLADLDVSYSGGSSGNANDAYNQALACMEKWKVVLTSNGEVAPGTSLKPSMVIKGRLDPDRPTVGRGWEPISTYAGFDSNMPAANTKSQYTNKRRWQRDYSSYRWAAGRFGNKITGIK